MSFKDFTGKVVKEGDFIFYSTTGRHPESRIGQITRFTEKSLFVKVIKTNKNISFDIGKEVVAKNTFVKIEYDV